MRGQIEKYSEKIATLQAKRVIFAPLSQRMKRRTTHDPLPRGCAVEYPTRVRKENAPERPRYNRGRPWGGLCENVWGYQAAAERRGPFGHAYRRLR